MNRQFATKLLRETLDKQGLHDWTLRLSMDHTKMFLGMCSYKDKCIILNAHHVDTHPDLEIIDTIYHEVAHALCAGHNHDEVWAAKASELGCTNTSPCVTYSLDAKAIDAIRSGADLEITYEERIVREPKYKIHKLVDKCKVCGKVAITKSEKIVKTSDGIKKVVTLECNHIQILNADSQSDFDSLIFDGLSNCAHVWNKTVCVKCNAKRLFPYQIEGARFLESANGRAAIFDEMGLGKTIQALAYLKYNADAFPYLWITKSGIKFQHCKEIVRLLGMPYFPQVIMGGRTTLIKGMKGYVASYDIFRRMSDLKMFVDAGIKTIVIDECQAIKNPDSTRTACIRQIAKLLDIDAVENGKPLTRIIPLSGTPWKNRGSEFFVVLNMLDPKRFNSFEKFKRDWVDYYFHGDKTKEGGIKDPAAFKEYIKDIAIRRERIDVMPELPLINRTRMLCEVPEHARTIYNEEQKKLIDAVNESIISGTEDSFATNQVIMQSLIMMRQIVGLAKVDTTVNAAKDFLEDTERKLVIFVHHKKCAEYILTQLTTWCTENGLPAPLSLTADLNSAERFAVQEKFNSSSYRVMVASTLASGEGLNLQTCSDCIMHERQWNPANEEQAEGRFIRIGQTAQSVNAIYVHGDDTVDTILDEIVENKRIHFHNSMNKNQLVQWNESSILDELVKGIMAKGKRNDVYN